MSKRIIALMTLFIALAIWSCQKDEFWKEKTTNNTTDVTFRAEPGETAGNNLSFPVIWAEGRALNLREVPDDAGEVKLDGSYWFWWGSDPANPAGVCDGCTPPVMDYGRAYVQKDENNVWQAETADGSAGDVIVDWIDWGDNLESVDWYTKSKVRTEVVLYKDLLTSMTEYQMIYLEGLGIGEVHGLAADNEGNPYYGPGTQATVYSDCAQLIIQKLAVTREVIDDNQLAFDAESGWKEGEGVTDEIVYDPIFNKSVYAAGDGPGYYNAEINVKGKVIFGYTWDVKNLNDKTDPDDPLGKDPSGDYRITFNFDDRCLTEAGVEPNAFFESGITDILPQVEGEEVVLPASPDGEGGAEPKIDFDRNLTYVDVRILPGKTGQNSGNGKGGGNSDGNNPGGGNDNGNGPKDNTGGGGGNGPGGKN